MVSATLMRPNTSAPSDGSRTLTLLDVQSRPSGSNDEPVSSTDPAPLGVLMLRGGPRRTRRRVAWDEDVVDNEGAGRKKSKSAHWFPSSLCRVLMLPICRYQFVVYTTNRRDSTNPLQRSRLIRIRILIQIAVMGTGIIVTLWTAPLEDVLPVTRMGLSEIVEKAVVLYMN